MEQSLDCYLSSSQFIADLREKYGWSYCTIDSLYKTLGKGYEHDFNNIVKMGNAYGLNKDDVISIITKAYELKTQAGW